MPDSPWTQILVGHHWPGDATLETLAAGARNRHALSAAFECYADSLRTISRGPLGHQVGTTADDARQAFAAGESHARTVAETNLARKAALERAHALAAEFRSQLAEIAERGSDRIQTILASRQHREAKVSQIVDLVGRSRAEANARAAVCAQDLLGSIQSVLNHSRVDMSAREFAAAHGFNHQRLSTTTHSESVRGQVERTLSAARAPVQSVPEAVRTPAHLPVARADAPTGAPTSAPTHTRLAAPASLTPRLTPRLMPGAGSGTPVLRGIRARAESGPDTTRDRLLGLLHAVARQEPLLRWVIDDRVDGRVVLTTDLAGGWIPPHVTIPAGVSLLAPHEPLRPPPGPSTTTLTFLPGGHLPPADTALIPAPEARHTPPVADLGAQLARATQGGRGNIVDVARNVLDSYPLSVNPSAVRTWQLLAACAEFTEGQVQQANYHFSWFLAGEGFPVGRGQ